MAVFVSNGSLSIPATTLDNIDNSVKLSVSGNIINDIIQMPNVTELFSIGLQSLNSSSVIINYPIQWTNVVTSAVQFQASVDQLVADKNNILQTGIDANGDIDNVQKTAGNLLVAVTGMPRN